jgi:ERF superfamily
MKDLVDSLAKAQGEFPTIPRSRSVEVRMKSGGSYAFKYAPMETIIAAVRPVLAKHGISLCQTIDAGSMWTVLAKGDASLKLAPVPMNFREGMSAQEMGSELTYKQRYSLKIALCLATDDDDDANYSDGNAWSATDRGPSIDVSKQADQMAKVANLADLAGLWEGFSKEERHALAGAKDAAKKRLTENA